MSKLYLTRKEVKELLGISDRTISRKIKQGKLKVDIKNNKQLFPKEQFKELEVKEVNVYDTLVNTLQKEVESLKEQLADRNKHIDDLTRTLNNEQALALKDKEEKVLLLEQPKKSWIDKILGK
jgi:predicted site-specific integrase-resolvase